MEAATEKAQTITDLTLEDKATFAQVICPGL